MTIRAQRRKATSLWKHALLVVLLAFTAISIACADTRAKRMDAWVGYTIDDLIIQWGAPIRTAKLSDGRMVYSWISVKSVGRTHRSNFTVSKDGIIEGWSHFDTSIPDYPR